LIMSNIIQTIIEINRIKYTSVLDIFCKESNIISTLDLLNSHRYRLLDRLKMVLNIVNLTYLTSKVALILK
jgi:hypothetical protein